MVKWRSLFTLPVISKMKRAPLLIAAASAICSLLVACRATTPGRIESDVAQWTKLHVTVKGKSDKNPLSNSIETVRSGKAAFGHYCVVCHGLDGQNTGVPFAANLSPPVPSLASSSVQSYSDGQLKWIIENGIAPSGMPASRGILNNDEMWAIVVYLRHLPPAGSLGEPRVYSGEEAEDEQK
jgi:mono/diheme cytochrome c family protein